MKAFFGQIGRTLFFLLAGISRLFSLFLAVCRVVINSFYQPRVIGREHVAHQMLSMGVDSVPIVAVASSAVGMVIALQAAYQLKMFGAVLYTGSLVSVSMARELGPLIAAIIVSGRVGARIAAELGTMMVEEEVDALKTMGLNPIAFLVAPRMLALALMLPCLAVVADVCGMLGGFLIGTVGVGINPYLYLAKNFDALVLKDIYSGLVKSGIFALLIGMVSCHEGLAVEGGAEGVGKATTQAVVTSIVLIIVTDCLATAIIYYALPT